MEKLCLRSQSSHEWSCALSKPTEDYFEKEHEISYIIHHQNYRMVFSIHGMKYDCPHYVREEYTWRWLWTNQQIHLVICGIDG